MGIADGIPCCPGRPWGENGYASDLVTATPLAVGSICRITVTREGETFNLYKDGVLDASVTTSSVTEVTRKDDNKPFRFGSRLPGVSDAFPGNITKGVIT